MSYQDYLKSPQWKQLSTLARRRANNCCEFCGSFADHVHHVKYPANKNYQGDCLENLVVVCASCHNKQHGIRGLKMKEIVIIEVDGFKITTTTKDDGSQWIRMSDVMLAIDSINKNSESFQNTIASTLLRQKVDWEWFENITGNFPVTERFLSLSGFSIVTSNLGKNEFAKNLRHEMADAWAKKKRGEFDFNEHEMKDPLMQSMAVIMQLRREQMLANLKIEKHDNEIAKHNSEIKILSDHVIDINEKIKNGIEHVAILHYKTARMYLDEQYAKTGIKSGSMYPGTSLTCASKLGMFCKDVHDYKLESPPKIQEGSFLVTQWPIETLKKAFQKFMFDYSKIIKPQGNVF